MDPQLTFVAETKGNSSFESDAIELRRSDFFIKPFLQRSDLRASWQLITTIAPVAGLWWLVAIIDQSSISQPLKCFAFLPVLGLLALFSSRAFSLMHDCGHGSLFRTRRLNRLVGFLLGVLNAIPQHPWSRDHAFHHRHNGNWEVYRGPIDVLTLENFEALSKREKLIYAISRHWLMLFPGGFYYLVIKPRLTLIQASVVFICSLGTELLDNLRGKNLGGIFTFSSRLRSNYSGYGNTSEEIIDLIFNNLLVVLSWFLMSKWLGGVLFWSCYSIVMASSAAIFICIFFIQHNFRGSYASNTDNWSPLMGSVAGSSNLDLPGWVNWFFADISFHSLHHICDRIPNYNLRKCHFHNKHLLRNAMTLRLVDIPDCFDYILWDSQSQELTTIQTANRSN